MTNLLKKNLVAVAVLCAMATGYRRAGFALEQGENLLSVDQEQYEKLTADKALTVTVVDTDLAQEHAGDFVTVGGESNADSAYLLDQNATLKGEIISLSNELAEVKKQLVAAQVVTHEDTLHSLAAESESNTYINGLDVSTAPEKLQVVIGVIDAIANETPLTKRPSCKDLAYTTKVEGSDDVEVTPSAAEADAAWAWYQKNVVVAAAASTAETQA